MDELIIQGKKYISSKRAAEISGYAKDYVGQLIRSGKLHGVRFGRAWYVDEMELMKHAGKDAKAPETGSLTVQALEYQSQASIPHTAYPNVQLPSTWQQVKYMEDESDLLPRLSEITENNKSNTEDSSGQKIQLRTQKAHSTGRISNSAAENSRVANLMQDVQIKSPMVRVAQPQRIQKTSFKARAAVPIKRQSQLPMVPITAAFAVIAIGLGVSGIFLSSEAIYNAQEQAYTASVAVGSENILYAIEHSEFVRSGLAAVEGFFSTILASIGEFIAESLKFLKLS